MTCMEIIEIQKSYGPKKLLSWQDSNVTPVNFKIRQLSLSCFQLNNGWTIRGIFSII